MPDAPLILTLKIDDESHDYFTKLRNKHFPKHCNYLEAHLTLFHKLPADNSLIDDALKNISNREIVDLAITEIKNIGNGVAFAVDSPELRQMHLHLQQDFGPYLISQDRQKIWPHITIQNKVTAFKAQQTATLLSESFVPFSVKGIGIESWLYFNGPWEKKRSYPFHGSLSK